MDIREASADDDQRLQDLQARCPQGTTLVVSLVNTPDFFARVKAYPTYRVYVACEDGRIIGSGAAAVRDGMVDGRPCRVGYEFQAFVAPEARRKGVAGALHRCREQYLIEQGAAMSYALTLEGNSPAMAHLEYEGFRPHRTLVMPILHVYREMSVPPTAKIRSAEPGRAVICASRRQPSVWLPLSNERPPMPSTTCWFWSRPARSRPAWAAGIGVRLSVSAWKH